MTAVTLDELAMRSDEKCPLAGNNRYLMRPPGASKLASVQRMTNFIKAIEDTYNLDKWNCRNVAMGIARNDDLRDLVISIRPDDKEALNDICEKAKELAGGNKKSRAGTARHGLAELVDLGEMTLDEVPMPVRLDIAAYRTQLDNAHMDVVECERYVLHPDLLVGGRFDRVVSFGSLPKMLDIKTGSLDFSGVAIAAQLYGYASAPYWYDPKTEKCTPAPEIDQEHGLVAHVPAGQGTCTLYWVDLAVGKRAFELAAQVREIRKLKNVFDPWHPGTRFDAVVERRARLMERLEALRVYSDEAIGAVAHSWPKDLPTLKHATDHTPEQLNKIDALLTAVEDKFQAPFGPKDPNNGKATQ